MRIHCIFLLFLLSLLSCSEGSNETLSFNGEWEFSEATESDWMKASIPGVVQTDLLENGIIPHPFKANNEDSIQWVSSKNWKYKKSFNLTTAALKKNKHYLKFDGLDSYVDVYLNDSLILNANNAFRSWEIDVTDILLKENKLLLLFKSLDSIENALASKIPYKLPEAPRVFTRKPQFQYGWDWGPTIKTMGAFKNISLISFNDIRVKDAVIELDSLIIGDRAELTAKLEIEVYRPTKITLLLADDLDFKFEHTFDVSPINTVYTIPIVIEDPKLWWTHNMGEPHLYDFNFQIKKGKSILDSFSKKVGIRTIELVTEKDSIGESFYFKLNDRPVYMKGANYIPQNIFLSEVSSGERANLLNKAVDANMNMLRVWGGGTYEEDEFYDLCDEKGILIWQDFMYACAMYPGDDEFLENAKLEAIENVKRLRQHPSIALWCGNNENSEGWHRWGWKDGRSENEKQEIWSNYYALFNHILPKVVDSLALSVNYWESSPKYGRGDPRYQYEGDAHDWWVWHDAYPFEHYEDNVPRFMSEFGFQSFPSYSAIQFFTEQDSIDLEHPSFLNHQKHVRGFKLIKEYMSRDYPVPLDDKSYVYVSQLLQAYGIIKGIEAHRRAKPYNMGTLYWQLNDCWPVVSWSSIDGLGNKKALHYKVKEAFNNILISTKESKGVVTVYIVNDSFDGLNKPFQISLSDFTGNSIPLYESNFYSPPNSSMVAHILVLDKKEYDPSRSFLKIEYGAGERLHFFEKPKNLNLPKVDVKLETTKNNEGYSILLSSEVLQKDVFLYSDSEGDFSDNFFDIPPGESRTVEFKTDNKETPIIEFITLNKLLHN